MLSRECAALQEIQKKIRHLSGAPGLAAGQTVMTCSIGGAQGATRPSEVATVGSRPMNAGSGSCPPLVLLVLAVVLLLSSGRAGQPCVLVLSFSSCPPVVPFLTPAWPRLPASPDLVLRLFSSGPPACPLVVLLLWQR